MTGTPAGTTTDRCWPAALMWLLPPLLELPVVAALYAGVPEVAREAVFGVPASLVAVLLALVAAVGGFVATARGTSGLAQAATGGALSIAAGVVAALGAGFVVDGSFPVLGVLMAHAAASLAMLARATLRADPYPE
jgi:hypothetical protein